MADHLSLRFLCILAFLLSAKCAWAQLVLVNSSHDFGVLTRADARHADFAIRNEGSKEEVLFRVEVPKGVEVKMSSKTIAPGATETIRLHLNPQNEGPFSIEARAYASAWMQPRLIQVTGESTFAAQAIPCPDFGSDPAAMSRSFSLSLRDSGMTPLSGAQVQFYREGKLALSTRSDVYGEISVQLPPARYFVSARFGSLDVDTAVYTSAVLDHVLLLFPKVPDAKADPAAADFPEQEVPSITAPEEDLEQELPEAAAPKAPQELKSPLSGDNPLMPLSEYKQNNVVFLVDVSTSMKHQGRLDLLKIAMTDLLGLLRDADRFTLISYAGDTRLLLEATHSLNRDEVAAAIAGLQARGSTEGAKALDFAGKEALKYHLPEGQNTIYIATDGAFNEGASLAKRLVRKYRKQAVDTSVLCIRCGMHTTSEMMELAHMGGGSFVPIEGPLDAGEALINDVKRASRR